MTDSYFDYAVSVVLKHEGFFSNDPDDPGGATKYGISLRYLKKSGKGDFDNDGDVDIDDIKKMSIEDAKRLYKKDWWDKYRYKNISSLFIATKVLDLSVNMGAHQAHQLLQRAVWAVDKKAYSIKDDGILGDITLSKVDTLNDYVLLPAFRAEAAGFYRSLNRTKFIRGWLNRAYA